MQTVGFGGKSAQLRENDPTFVCSAFKKNRFYLFTQREPVEPEDQKQGTAALLQTGEMLGRDMFNEKLGKEAEVATASGGKGSGGAKSLPSKAIIYTSLGEIHVELYP